MAAYEFPDFDQLPSLLANHHVIIAINLLNAETVKEAAKEIQTGRHFLGFGRILIEHNVRLMEKEASVKLTRMMDVCEKGGIVGRGILVNWLRWWEHQNPGKEAPSAISTYSIPASELEEVLKFQGTEYRQGDILIVRTGFVRWHEYGTSPESKILTLIDVGSNMDTVRWLYSKHFSLKRWSFFLTSAPLHVVGGVGSPPNVIAIL
ncbi:hypothetical protein HDV64DRAFT_273546 [Trichoderma sp. TUCIM 5745]